MGLAKLLVNSALERPAPRPTGGAAVVTSASFPPVLTGDPDWTAADAVRRSSVIVMGSPKASAVMPSMRTDARARTGTAFICPPRRRDFGAAADANCGPGLWRAKRQRL